MKQNTIIVTGADSFHFYLVEDFIKSFRAEYQDKFKVAFVMFGPDKIPASISERFDIIVRQDRDYANFDSKPGYYMAYAAIKANLRELVPGFDTYCWVDSDCWFQTPHSIPRIIENASSFDICVHPEFDVHYKGYETPTSRTLKIYEINERDNLDKMPLRLPMINAGVFAMSSSSKIWGLWRSEMKALRKRHKWGENIYFSDQIPLHKILYTNAVNFQPIRAIDNWQTYACPPRIDFANGTLTAPTNPFESIGIIHLAGQTKYEQYRHPLFGHFTLLYRDFKKTFPSKLAETAIV